MVEPKPSLSLINWRLRFEQQARWTYSIRQYLLPRAGLNSASKLLEVGCGPGVILDEIAREAPIHKGYANSSEHGPSTHPGRLDGLSLHGLDIRSDYLHYYKKQSRSAHLVQADAHQLPYQTGAFDLVICHFLLLWVKDALEVVREMKRACQPGAALLVLAEPDYGGRVDYPQELSQPGRLQALALQAQGADPEIGRKLGYILSEAGLKEIETGILGGQWSGPPGEGDWQMEWQVIRDDLEGMASQAEIHEWQEIDQKAWISGSRTLFVPTFYAWGKC